VVDVFEEADLRLGLKDGGRVLGAFIIARGDDQFVVYARVDWIRGRGFRIIRTWRGTSGDRAFKNLQSAWHFIQKFDFFGRVTIYPVGDTELHHFVGIAACDLVDSSYINGGKSEGVADLPDAPKPRATPD